MTYELKNRVVVVTGASSGIGAEAARAFAEAGCAVTLLARRADRIEALAAELKGKGFRALAHACDVRSDDEVNRAFAAVETTFGGVDVLVNNAGLGLYGKVLEVDPEQLKANYETNVFGVLRCIRVAVPSMRRRGGGQILNVSSVLGHRALPFMGGYSSSKFALQGLSESLRVELASEKIDVIVVCPGITESEFRQNAMSASGWKEPKAPFPPMKAREVADAMVEASRRQKREIVLTRSGRSLLRFNRFAPGMCDRMARKMVNE